LGKPAGPIAPQIFPITRIFPNLSRQTRIMEHSGNIAIISTKTYDFASAKYCGACACGGGSAEGQARRREARARDAGRTRECRAPRVGGRGIHATLWNSG
jgi:hypothetical protein